MLSRDTITTLKVLSKSMIALLVIVSIMSGLFVLPAEAAINQQINYQGKLTDGSGTEVTDGTYSIVFRLYTVSSGGSHIWTETQSVTVTDGLFSVMLGSGTSLASVDFNQTLYLGVNVGGDGEMVPRKIIGSVPTAFTSDKLDNLDSTDFLSTTTASAPKLWSLTGLGEIGSSSATSTVLGRLSVVGTTIINGLLSAYQTITAPNFVATSTTASIFPYASSTAISVSGTGFLTNLNVSGNSTLGTVTSGLWNGSTIGVGYGGTGLTSTPSYGQILVGNGTGYTLSATSTLGIALADTTGTLGGTRGGTGLSSVTLNQLLIGGAGNTWTQVATSSLGLPTFSSLADYLTLSSWYATTTDGLDEGGTNLYFTDNRFDARLSATTSLPNIWSLTGLGRIGSSSAVTTIAGTASSSALIVSGGAQFSSLLNCDTLDTDASGNLSCGVDAGAGGGISSLNGLSSASQTFATSSDTNVTLTVTSTGSTHTFTSGWTGTLAVGRGGTGLGSTPSFGQILVGNGTGYTLSATSTLGVALSDTTGTLGGTRGGTGLSSVTLNELLIGGAGNTWSQVATSSLGILTTNVAEGSNLYFLDSRARAAISETISGIDYDNSSGVFSLTSGFNIPLTASTTNWNSFYDTPSTRITAGTGLSWAGNTLSVTGGSGTNDWSFDTNFSSSVLTPSSTIPVWFKDSVYASSTLTVQGADFATTTIGSNDVYLQFISRNLLGILDVPIISGRTSLGTSGVGMLDTFNLIGDSSNPSFDFYGTSTFNNAKITFDLSSDVLNFTGTEGYYFDNNLGIGSSSPFAKLSVDGNVIFQGNAFATTTIGRNDSYLQIKDYFIEGVNLYIPTLFGRSVDTVVGALNNVGVNNALSILEDRSLNAEPVISFAPYDAANSSNITYATTSNQLKFDSSSFYFNNNLGIGSTTPNYKLSVDGAVTFQGTNFATTTIGSTNSYVTVSNKVYSGGLGTFNFPNIEFNTPGGGVGNNLGGFMGGIALVEKNTSATNPSLSFFAHDWADTVNIGSVEYATSTQTFIFGKQFKIRDTNDDLILSFQNDAETADANIEFDETTDQLTFNSASGGHIFNNNVGIGTTSPAYLLDVGGYINSSIGYKIDGHTVIRASSTADNVIVGPGAGGIDGLANTVVGVGALASADSNTRFNTAIGNGALDQTTGIGNTALGSNVGAGVTSGSNNILIGVNTSVTTGSFNILMCGINSLACSHSDTADYQLNIADTIQGDLLNKRVGIGSSTPWAKLSVTNTGSIPSFIVEDSTSPDATPFIIDASGNVGIGDPSPTSKLSVVGDINISSGSYYKYNGTNLLYASTTLDSYFIGNTGNTANTGIRNIGIGINALLSNTSGAGNIAVGYGALDSNATGLGNVGIGDLALSSGSTGSYNTAVGASANANLGDGSYNTALGYGALGSGSVSVPRSDVVALGALSLGNAFGGTSTVAVGSGAAYGNSGYSSQNGVYVGHQAGYLAQSGSNSNTFLGYQSGYNVTTGANNIIIGANILAPSAADNQQLNIGNVLYGTGVYNGSASSSVPVSGARIGIGTTTPWRTLSVEGLSDLGTNALAGSFTATSTNASSTINGSLTLNAIGKASGSEMLRFGSDRAWFFRTEGTGSTNALVTKSETASKSWFINASDDSNVATFNAVSSGNSAFGVGTTTPWRTLSVNGTVGFQGLTLNTGAASASLCLSSTNQVTRNTDNESCITSSQRFKHDIETLDATSTIEALMAFRPVSFEYNSAPGSRLGLIAEEVELIDERLVGYDDEGRVNSVRYTSIIPILIQTVQNIWNKLTNHEDRLEELERENAELKARVDAISGSTSGPDESPSGGGEDTPTDDPEGGDVPEEETPPTDEGSGEAPTEGSDGEAPTEESAGDGSESTGPTEGAPDAGSSAGADTGDSSGGSGTEGGSESAE